MEFYEILECCGRKISTGTEDYKKLDCFRPKKIKEKQDDGTVIEKEKFFKRKLSDGRDIKKEVLIVGCCPNCGHWILKYLWYASKHDRFHDWAESKDIKGKKADEIFRRRADDYEFYKIPDPFKGKRNIKHSKKIPWIYYKNIGVETQIPRYIDETDNAGRKIYNPLKTESLL